MQWFVSVCGADDSPGTDKDVDYFYQHHESHARYVYGKVLPPRDWHPYNKAGGTGAGRTAEGGPHGVPSLKLEYRWTDPDLQAIAEESMHAMDAFAAQHAYGHTTGYHSAHPSHLPSNNTSLHRNYGQTSPAWDEDDDLNTDLYGDESKGGYSSYLGR